MSDPLIRAIELLERCYKPIPIDIDSAECERRERRAGILAFLRERACTQGYGHAVRAKQSSHSPSDDPACAARAAIERLEPKPKTEPQICKWCDMEIVHVCPDPYPGAPMDWAKAERVLKDAYWGAPADGSHARGLRARFLLTPERTRELYDAIMKLEAPDA